MIVKWSQMPLENWAIRMSDSSRVDGVIGRALDYRRKYRVQTKLDITWKDCVHYSGRFILGVIFIWAAIYKISSPLDFADNIAAYQILPPSLINLLALGLPLFELGCGALICLGIFRRVGLLGILAMLTVFMAATVDAVCRGAHIQCGCFGMPSWLDSNPLIVLLRDACLLTLAIILYRRQWIEVKAETISASRSAYSQSS
jgi:hypothetical protein